MEASTAGKKLTGDLKLSFLSKTPNDSNLQWNHFVKTKSSRIVSVLLSNLITTFLLNDSRSSKPICGTGNVEI